MLHIEDLHEHRSSTKSRGFCSVENEGAQKCQASGKEEMPLCQGMHAHGIAHVCTQIRHGTVVDEIPAVTGPVQPAYLSLST
jgi:hypothetical protein